MYGQQCVYLKPKGNPFNAQIIYMKFFTFISILFFAVQVFAQDNETISWKDAKINNRIALTLSKSEFEEAYKKADSIVDALPGETCSKDKNVMMLHYKGLKYELNNDLLNFRSIDFTRRRNMYISFKDEWFDNTTTLKSFAKTYPDAAAYIEDYENEQGEAFEIVTLYPTDIADLYEWRFFFKKGKLQLIECKFTCP